MAENLTDDLDNPAPGGKSAFSSGSRTSIEEIFFVGELPVFQEEVFLLLLGEEIKRWKRYGVHFAVLMIRVDFEDGRRDENLESGAAKKIRGTLREVDQIGRFGENFLITLPATDQQGAGVVLDRLSALPGLPPRVRIQGTVLPYFEREDLYDTLDRTALTLSGQ